jgi:hypothetical protein
MERQLFFDRDVWCSEWSRELSCYEVVGPCRVIGIEINCDDIRGHDCLILSQAKHTHHNPEDVWQDSGACEKHVQRANKTLERRRKLQEAINKKA